MKALKAAAMVIAVLTIAAGIAIELAPEALMQRVTVLLTPGGLLIIAAVRIVVGLVLLAVASGSRAPRVLQVIGVLVIIGGLFTPFFGVERARLVFDWETAQGPMLIRLIGLVPLLLGAFLAFAVTGRRTAAS